MLIKGSRNRKEDQGTNPSWICLPSRMSVVEHAIFRALAISVIFRVEKAAEVV
jgi:hypothetical protein